jgi:hypothetical protein
MKRTRTTKQFSEEVQANELQAHAHNTNTHHGQIQGIGNRILVRTKQKEWWAYTPGKPDHFHRNRIHPFIKVNKMPALKKSRIILQISREEFGRIYPGLMNEINVHKLQKNTHTPPFSRGLQKDRAEQGRLIMETKKPVYDIHNHDTTRNFPYAGMTEEPEARIVIDQPAQGHPTIEITNYHNKIPSKEVYFLQEIVTGLLTMHGIPHTITKGK